MTWVASLEESASLSMPRVRTSVLLLHRNWRGSVWFCSLSHGRCRGTSYTLRVAHFMPFYMHICIFYAFRVSFCDGISPSFSIGLRPSSLDTWPTYDLALQNSDPGNMAADSGIRSQQKAATHFWKPSTRSSCFGTMKRDQYSQFCFASMHVHISNTSLTQEVKTSDCQESD